MIITKENLKLYQPNLFFFFFFSAINSLHILNFTITCIYFSSLIFDLVDIVFFSHIIQPQLYIHPQKKKNEINIMHALYLSEYNKKKMVLVHWQNSSFVFVTHFRRIQSVFIKGR